MERLRNLYRELRWKFFWKNFKLPEVSLQDLVPCEKPLKPTITENLCLPPYEGTTDHDDVDALLRLITHLEPHVVLELGTAQGATVANICAISDAEVYTVNALPEQISGQITTFVLSKDEIGFVYRKHGFSGRVVQIFENTKQMDLSSYLDFDIVDFTIIDACHDTDYVINDFLKVLPVLKDEGIVLFHDVHPSMKSHLVNSYVACMYLRRLGFNVCHLNGTWWAFWQRQGGLLCFSRWQKFVTLMENILLKIVGYDMLRDALHLRRLASIFAKSKSNKHELPDSP
jgi:predicted O-methyltransferase YrrM